MRKYRKSAILSHFFMDIILSVVILFVIFKPMHLTVVNVNACFKLDF